MSSKDTPIEDCQHLPCIGNLCWLRFDGLSIKGQVTHRSNCHYYATNIEAFIDSRGELVPVGELQSLPPGTRNDQFRLYTEGKPAPEWNDKAKKWNDTPPKMTPLF